jgi:hypothetical protein
MSKIFFVSLILIFLISIDIVLAEYRIDAVEYPKELLIERGWTNYFNVVVKNIGDSILNNVTIYFDDEFSQWFEVTTNKTDVLQISANSSFMVKLSVPPDAEAKSYSFNLYTKSQEITSSKTFTLKVFESKKGMMLYQVQKLELEIEYIKLNATKVENSGKNVSSVMDILDEAKDYVDASKNYINNEKFQEATELMINIENLIKKANYDLSIAPPKIPQLDTSGYSFSYDLFIIIPILAVAALGFYVLKLRSRASIKPPSTIKSALLEVKKPNLLETQLSEAENSKKLVEDEFKENLISKESYDELIEKYEKIISDLKQEIEKKRAS